MLLCKGGKEMKMGANTLSIVWQNMWKQHYTIKNMLLFAVTGKEKSIENEKTLNNEHKKVGPEKSNSPKYYTKQQLIGLVLGPLLFIMTMLFFST